MKKSSLGKMGLISALAATLLSGCVTSASSIFVNLPADKPGASEHLFLRYSDGNVAAVPDSVSTGSVTVSTYADKTIVGGYVTDNVVSWVPALAYGPVSDVSVSEFAAHKPAIAADHVALAEPLTPADSVYPTYINVTLAVYGADGQLVDGQTEIFAHAADPETIFKDTDTYAFSNGGQAKEGYSSFTVDGKVTFKILSDSAEITTPISIYSGAKLLDDNLFNTVTGISVSGAGDINAVQTGETLSMTAAVLPADAVMPAVVWSVANGTGTAVIDAETGELTAGDPGSVTVTATATDGSGISGSVEVTITAVPTPTPSPTPDPTPSPTPDPTASPTPDPTPSPTPDPTASPTPDPTASPTPDPTASPTPDPTPSPTPDPTASPTPDPTPSPTPDPTASPTPDPTASPTPDPTPSPTPDPTPSPTPDPTASPTPDPTASPTPDPTPSPTPDPTPSPTPDPTPSPTPDPVSIPGSAIAVTTAPTPSPSAAPTAALTPTAGAAVKFAANVVKLEELLSSMSKKIEQANANPAPVQFSDISAHWANLTVETFVKLGIVQGYQDGGFHPNASLSRAEFAAVIAKVFDLSGSGSESTLSDISGHWAEAAVRSLQDKGLVSGYQNGTFKPDAEISRAEMISIISKLVDLSGVDAFAATAFVDVSGTWNQTQIQKAAAAGIISGPGNGQFQPAKQASRAEALTVVLRVLELNPELKALLETLK